MRLNAWAELANALGVFDTIGNLVSEIENRTILDIDDRRIAGLAGVPVETIFHVSCLRGGSIQGRNALCLKTG